MRGWTRTHLYAGIAIVLVVVIAGCCTLSLFGGMLRPRPIMGDSYRWPGWGPADQSWGLTSLGLVGWAFGLLGLAVYTIVVVLLTLLVAGRLPRIWRRRDPN